jgi:hypothetical protein
MHLSTFGGPGCCIRAALSLALNLIAERVRKIGDLSTPSSLPSVRV